MSIRRSDLPEAQMTAHDWERLARLAIVEAEAYIDSEYPSLEQSYLVLARKCMYRADMAERGVVVP